MGHDHTGKSFGPQYPPGTQWLCQITAECKAAGTYQKEKDMVEAVSWYDARNKAAAKLGAPLSGFSMAVDAAASEARYAELKEAETEPPAPSEPELVEEMKCWREDPDFCVMHENREGYDMKRLANWDLSDADQVIRFKVLMEELLEKRALVNLSYQVPKE